MHSGRSCKVEYLERVIQEPIEQEMFLDGWPILPLMPDVRRLAWNLYSVLKLKSRGIAGNACRLMERYMAWKFKYYSETLRDTVGWVEYREEMGRNLCLMIASCIQIAVKMNANESFSISPSKVRSALLDVTGVDHTAVEIKMAELAVYKTLQFRVMLWTSVETAHFLARLVGWKSSRLLLAIEYAVEIAEYNQYFLEIYMQTWNEPPASSQSSNSSDSPTRQAMKPVMQNVHLCASVVIAAAKFMSVPCQDEMAGLAKLTRISVEYIRAAAHYILNHILEDTYIPILKKRRLS